MNKKILLFLSVVQLFSLNCSNKKLNLDHKILFYYRIEGNNNGYVTFRDLLIIDNYENQTMTLDSLSKVAQKYVDSVHAPWPVSSVIFVGKKPNGNLPEGSWNTWFSQKKYFVVDFEFSNYLRKFKAKPFKIIRVGIWKNEKVENYPAYGADGIDSIIGSNQLLDNGN